MQVVVSDFGLCAIGKKNVNGAWELVSNSLCGTLSYLAPEQLQKKSYDPYAADVFSLGVTMFILLTTFLPFDDDDTLRERIPIDVVKEASSECRRKLEKMLEPNPMKRIKIHELYADSWFHDSCPDNTKN